MLSLAILMALSCPQDPGEGTPVTVEGLDSLTLGGQIRLRGEHRNAMPPMTGAPSATATLLRARVHLDAQVDEHIGGFLQVQHTIAGQGNGSRTQLHQGYAELSQILDLASVQGGRFEMSYGDQRMVSPLDWSNTGRAWDGARVVLEQGPWRLDLFGTQPVSGQGGVTGKEDFWGAYGQWEGEPVAVDVYAFKYRDLSVLRDDYTVGGLVKGQVDQLSFSLEGAVQVGDHGALDAGGYAVAARLDVDLGPATVGVGAEIASGDGNPADGDDETFRRLFNFDHAYQGFADIVVWQNLNDFVLRTRVPITEGWAATGDVHLLSRAEAADLLYTGSGGGSVAAVPGGSRDIGTEVDLAVRGALGENLDVWTGVAFFSAGNGLVLGDDQIWFFFQTALNF